MSYRVLILLVVVGSYNIGNEALVSIEINGYSGIVVAFHPSMSEAEGEPLIEKIKELFINASHALYTATRRRAYFKQVTILVPQTWTKKPEYQNSASEIFNQASIRIDNPNPQYGDGPYTLQPMPCGHPGQYIHLTPSYLKNLKENSTTLFGDPGKTLVHEWAHYRYGIFDEFGYPGHNQFPLFYIDPINEEIRPNYCANEQLDGPYINTKLEDHPCKLGLDDIPDENCLFQPYLDNTANSSLGSYHYLPQVSVFCDDHSHNPYAPNKHNLLCNYKSTWKVISENEDFQNRNYPTDITGAKLVPTFNIVQQDDPIFILVLDLSSSMNIGDPYTRMDMLNSTVRRWIMDEVKLGWTIGIVEFSTTSDISVEPIKIQHDDDKIKLIKKVPSREADGYTCIGCGLRSALQALELAGKKQGGTIILVSDGDENRKPNVKDVIANVTAAKVRVISIAFTNATSSALEKVAKETGGKTFFVTAQTGIQAMGSAFYEAVVFQETDIDITVKLAENRFSGKSTTHDGYFVIDSTVGKNTKITFAYQEDDIDDIRIVGMGNVNVSMKTPSRVGYNLTNVSALQSIHFSFPYLQSGKYNFTIHRNKPSLNQVIVAQVFSTPATEGAKPITTRCWAAEEINNQMTTTNKIKRYIIYAEVKQGLNPVINSNVVAKVEHESSRTIYLPLLDNGSGAPDVTANDGIYSRYFTKALQKGRYTLTATVIGDSMSKIREMGFIASRSMPISNKYMTNTLQANDKDTGVFERFSDGGSFITEQAIAIAGDVFPPARVTDLRLIKIAPDNSNVTVQWTAPGDDSDFGNASLYEVKYSPDRSALFEDFEHQGIKLTSLVPKPAGNVEEYKFVLKGLKPSVTLYMSLRTKDKIQWSPNSNIIEINGVKPIPPTTTAATVKEAEVIHVNDTGLIIGVVIGVILLIVAAVAIGYIVKRRQLGLVV